MVGGISGWQLLILLLIVVLVFGTKRLRNIGSDLGSAVKGFRKGMEDEDKDETAEQIGSESSAAGTETRDKQAAPRSPGTDV